MATHHIPRARSLSHWSPTPWNKGVAQVAEIAVPAFVDDDEAVRLVVRRVNHDIDEPGADRRLIPDSEYHAFVTDRYDRATLEADAWHREHAQVQNVIKDLKYHGGWRTCRRGCSRPTPRG